MERKRRSHTSTKTCCPCNLPGLPSTAVLAELLAFTGNQSSATLTNEGAAAKVFPAQAGGHSKGHHVSVAPLWGWLPGGQRHGRGQGGHGREDGSSIQQPCTGKSERHRCTALC